MDKSLQSLMPILTVLRRYSVLIAIVIVGAVYAYIIYTSGSLAKVEPSTDQINEKYKTVKRSNIDQVIINKLNDLEDRNPNFQALLDEARANPFTEE